LYYTEHIINLIASLLPLSGMVQVLVEALRYLRRQNPCTYINHKRAHCDILHGT